MKKNRSAKLNKVGVQFGAVNKKEMNEAKEDNILLNLGWRVCKKMAVPYSI